MSPDLEKVIELLPKLGPEELDEVRTRASALKSITTTAPGKPMPDNDETLVLGAICEYMCSTGQEFTSPTLLKRANQFKPFSAKVPPLMEYVRTASTNRLEQQAILHLGLELLHRYLTKMGLSVGTRTLMQQIHRLPECINRQFPGYAESGMLPWILKGSKAK